MEDNDPVKVANEYAQRQRDEAAQKQAETLAQMEKNRQELDEKRKLVNELSQAMGIHQIQEDLDVVKQAINKMNENIVALNDAIVKTVNVVDEHTRLLNGAPQPQPAGVTAYTPSEQKIKDLAEVARTLAEVYKTIKGEPQVAPSIIPQDYINEKIKNSVLGNFEVGEALIDNLKSKLISKAITKTVTDTMLHEPE